VFCYPSSIQYLHFSWPPRNPAKPTESNQYFHFIASKV